MEMELTDIFQESTAAYGQVYYYKYVHTYTNSNCMLQIVLFPPTPAISPSYIRILLVLKK